MDSRPLVKEDLPFFKKMILSSPRWLKEEGLTGNESEYELETYMKTYDQTGGEWLIWGLNGEKIGATYLVYAAPSNGKPWLGTLLVDPEKRNQGHAREILAECCRKVETLSSVLFSSAPVLNQDWILFLNRNGFEQIGLEKDESGKEYIKFAKTVSPA
ncbi:Predicted N-acyltransferase, GNAT family [Fictibacillus solisalsi]|uniref:Predicted N-acyltransferase, GNAT family n=1 Tax=Fictibacillus solisalsi TaxID=459525 RepID=A0A1G9UQ73_9BACL|nr:GNAT family N-acetyltransferase [Fictibacillus solisalsi]SDM62014.1 Predicted N-acyltransferase, GNAT family [Fictibacillus solisalsi]